jgi:hypothetical protein
MRNTKLPSCVNPFIFMSIFLFWCGVVWCGWWGAVSYIMQPSSLQCAPSLRYARTRLGTSPPRRPFSVRSIRRGFSLDDARRQGVPCRHCRAVPCLVSGWPPASRNHATHAAQTLACDVRPFRAIRSTILQSGVFTCSCGCVCSPGSTIGRPSTLGSMASGSSSTGMTTWSVTQHITSPCCDTCCLAQLPRFFSSSSSSSSSFIG